MSNLAPTPAPTLTVPQAAELAQVHELTIRGWIKSGQVKAVKVGRTVRIPRTAFLSMLGVED